MKKPAVLDNFLLSDSQQTAALARGTDVAVTAGAGTGKTRTLVARYLALLAEGLPLRQIVAITFTRKAAREMRNRVREEIDRYLRQPDLGAGESQKWQTYYNELDAARIGTIHNLCAEILRAHPAEAEIDPRFGVLDETQAVLSLQEAVEATLAWAVETEELAPLFDLLGERELLELIAALLRKRLVAQEATSQLPAESIFDHWQDKLRDFQEKSLAGLLADPAFSAAWRALEMNQANKADDRAEVQRQVTLSALNALDGAALPYQLRDVAVLQEIDLRGGSQNSWPGGKEQLAKVKGALKRVRELVKGQPLLGQQLNGQDEAIAAAMPAIYTLFQYAQESYQGLKAERESLDFDDLEALAIQLLAGQEAARDYWQSQVQALLVDEFQDTNEQQRRFIRLLCPDAGKLFIVGDAKQSIYRFRGADVSVFASEKETIGGSGGQLIDLETSYRAHEPLLQGMNALLAPVLGDESPGRPSWVAPFAPLKAGTKTVEHGLLPPFIEFHLTLGSKVEAFPLAAAAMATRLARLHDEHDLDYGDMAVLCRASGSFQYYEDAFDNAGVPYLTVAGKGFYDRPEIRDLLNALKAIADPHDDLALTGLLRSPACALSDVALYQLSQQRAPQQTLWTVLQEDVQLEDEEEMLRLNKAVALVGELHQRAGRTRVADILKQFLDKTYYRAIMRRVGQPRALRNVTKLLNDIHSSELVSVNAFLEYAQSLRDSGTREGEARATAGGAVQIMSIHAAKGLEFPVIVLGDASSTGRSRSDIAVDPQLGILLPYKNDEQQRAASYEMWAALAAQQEEAETARLLYVALTRAEQMLLINGYAPQNRSGSFSWRGWLGELAEITGMERVDLSAYDDQGDEQHSFDFVVGETAARATFYEPYFATREGSLAESAVEMPAERPFAAPLQDPVPDAESSAPDEDERTRRAWQIVHTEKKATAPAWIIGKLVHEGLAFWRFPGEDFDEWLSARAKASGLTDGGQLQDAQEKTRELLERFRKSTLFREIDESPRRLHEVPYSYEQNGQLETGRIDVIYKTAVGWTVVDFKTDHIRNEADLRRMLGKLDYEKQLRAYGTAVQKLLRVVPQLKLCLLNFRDGVRVEKIQ